MNVLKKEKILKEIVYGQNFAYVLNNSNQFCMTDYKVLQSQNDSSFVKNVKILYNGRIEIYYLTKEYKSFSILLPIIRTEELMLIIANFFKAVEEVKNNGFLSYQNIDISFDKIFVDIKTFKVYLIYIPINEMIFTDKLEFENELRVGLAKQISPHPNLINEITKQFIEDISNKKYSLDYLFDKYEKENSDTNNCSVKPYKKNKNEKKMRIIALDAPSNVEICINKSEFIIGKNSSQVDGAIRFNKLFSRVHCKVTNQTGNFFITDLNSSNFTYINEEKLLSNKKYDVKNGDIIRLANSDFQVIIE